MSDQLLTVARAWREEAERIRHRYTDDRLARLCEVHAEELETALRTSLDETLTLSEAARVSGYSTSHLRRLLDEGRIPNAGQPGAPRIRLGDLPFKPGKAAPLGAMSAARRAAGRASARGTVRPVG